ncbi:MAG: LD-carboxypeptidase [Acidobacteria bacterium]|nr:MAG: LD-carboxypeptidase [Acidobacteriota bacterium]
MRTLIKPRAVRPGDRVAVVAPASPFDPEQLEAGLCELRRLGFEPVVDDRTFARRGYVAGPPEVRARALQDALDDPGIACVMAARGGYGSVQILPLLDPVAVARARKLIVGYSDLTSLLSFLTCQVGLACAHGPTVSDRLGRGRYDEASLLATLSGQEPPGVLVAPGLETLVEGEANGFLFGGNLTQLAASLGTPYAFDPPAGCLLLLEDVNERPYRLDRLWTQLRLAGILDRAAGIVLADFPGCDEPGGEVAAREVFAELARSFAGPVVFGLPTGHTAVPLTVPLGVRARILAGSRPAVVIEEKGTE